MATFLTPNRHGYSVRFSPINPDRLVVATSQYYGLAGGGTLFLLEMVQGSSGMIVLKTINWTDGLFDVVWPLQQNNNLVATASGDGTIQLWDLSLHNNCQPKPSMVYKGHTQEIYSIDCNGTKGAGSYLLSASWDETIKLWDPCRSLSLHTYSDHSELVYRATFSPHSSNGSIFASVSGDGYVKIWNLCDTKPSINIKAHDTEVLTCDWCNFNEHILATGGADGLIRGWDLRFTQRSLFELYGCEYAVRRVQFSPFAATTLASVSYDSTTRIWDYGIKSEALEIIRHHSEFTYGLDWNRLRKNQLADCGWDSLVHVFMPEILAA